MTLLTGLKRSDGMAFVRIGLLVFGGCVFSALTDSTVRTLVTGKFTLKTLC